MARRWISTVMMVLIATSVHAQVTEQWEVREDPGSLVSGNALAIDGQGRVFITGSGEGGHYVTVAYDATTGTKLWEARYDGASDRPNDFPKAIAVDGSGRVFVTGYSLGISQAGVNYATVAYDATTGTQLWAARYVGPRGGGDTASAIAVDGNGTVFVTGSGALASGDLEYTTLAYDAATGAQLWVASDTNGSLANAIAVDGSGTVYVTGVAAGVAAGYLTVAYDAMTGTQLWEARYHGPISTSQDTARAVAVDGLGGVYVTGDSAYASFSGTDYATVAYDAMTGTQRWVARYRGPADGSAFAKALAVDGSGTVYVTGASNSGSTNFEYATVAYDTIGTQLWVARYHGSAGGDSIANAIAVDGQGGAYVTGISWGGATLFDYATAAYDTTTGTQLWETRYDDPSHGNDSGLALAVDSIGTVYVTGSGGGGAGTVAYSQP